MHPLRAAISEPLEVDFRQLRIGPFSPLVAGAVPGGRPKHSESHAGGKETFNYYEGYVEQATRVDVGGYFVRYVLRVGDAEALIAYFLPDYLEVYYQQMVGRDFGDEVSPLVARRWPKTFELFTRSNGEVEWPALVGVHNSTSRQWAVAIGYTFDPMSELLPPDEVQDALGHAATQLVREQHDPDHEMLGEFVMAMGGDDYVNRQLKGAAKAINTLGDFTELFR